MLTTANVLQTLPQMLAGRTCSNYQIHVPMGRFPVTLLHGDGTRAGVGAQTGGGGGWGLCAVRGRAPAGPRNYYHHQGLSPAAGEEPERKTGNLKVCMLDVAATLAPVLYYLFFIIKDNGSKTVQIYRKQIWNV